MTRNINPVSSQSEQERQKAIACGRLSVDAAELFSHLCRVAAGAGDAHSALRAMAQFYVTLEEVETAKTLHKVEIQGALRKGLSSWIEEMSDSQDKHEFDRDTPLSAIMRGSLRKLASRWAGQRVQEVHADKIIYDGIRALEKIRADERKNWGIDPVKRPIQQSKARKIKPVRL